MTAPHRAFRWQLTIDCRDPGRLVTFWAPALGYVVQPAPAGFETWNQWYLSVGVPAEELNLDEESGGADRLIDPTGRGPRIWFQVVPGVDMTKNRLQRDLYAVERDRPYEARKRNNRECAEHPVATVARLWREIDKSA